MSAGAIVLTGGRGSRLGGIDKAGVQVGEATLLEHALRAADTLAGGSHHVDTVVVGPAVPRLDSTMFAREQPVGGAARDADTWDDVRALREEIR